MDSSNVPEVVASLAARQSGLVTLEQLEGLGENRSIVGPLLMAGEAITLIPGVVRIGKSRTVAEEPLAYWMRMAPTLTLEDRLSGQIIAVASHRTAAYVLGLGVSEDDRWTFTVPLQTEMENRQVNIVRGTLTTDEFVIVDGLPVTRPLRTITDLIELDADISEISTAVAFVSGDKSLASRTELAARLEKYRDRFGFDAKVDLVDALIEADMGTF